MMSTFDILNLEYLIKHNYYFEKKTRMVGWW